MLETRPNSELRPEMLLLAGEVHLRRVELSEARENYRQFLRDYPDHKRVKEAERRLIVATLGELAGRKEASNY